MESKRPADMLHSKHNLVGKQTFLCKYYQLQTCPESELFKCLSGAKSHGLHMTWGYSSDPVHCKRIRWWLHWWEWTGRPEIQCNDDAPRAAVWSAEPAVTAGNTGSSVSGLSNESRGPVQRKNWPLDNFHKFLHQDNYWLDSVDLEK